MVDYILNIDWMTTTEFCNETGAPLPNIRSGVDSFLQIDAIKHRMFVEYAKFLNKPITLELFIGKSKVFENFEVALNFEDKPVLRIIGENQVYAYINDDKFSMSYPKMAKKIEDLVSMGWKYNDR